MELNQIFYEWVPKYVRYAILLLMVFVALCANGVYLGITTDMYSDLGVYAEPYTMASNALYIGMGAGIFTCHQACSKILRQIDGRYWLYYDAADEPCLCNHQQSHI